MAEQGSSWLPPDPVARLLADELAGHDETEWPAIVQNLCTGRPEHAAALRRLFVSLKANGLLGAAPLRESLQLGNYRLVRRLGAGGMGVVWEAEQGLTGRRVAIKLIRPELLESEGAHRRFRREAELAASLQHPNLCTVFEAGNVDGQPFLAMQLVVGENLGSRLQAGPLPAERAVAIAERLARALHAAHQAGLVHRDVKPANVVLRSDDEPVLLDFGLARGIDQDSDGLTMTGEVVGTPAYLAPEQIESRVGPIDARTDVYGLGITLHELVTGRVPFAAPTRDGLYRRILAGDRQHTSLHGARLPRDLQAIVETAIDHVPGRRYATALDFANDLARLQRHDPVRARRAGPVLRLLRWSQRNRAAAALLVVLSLSLVVVAWSLRRASDSLADSRQRQLVLASVEAGRADPMLALCLARAAVDRRADFAAVTQLAAAVRATTEELHLDLPFQGGAQEVSTLPGGAFWVRGRDANRRDVAKVVFWHPELGSREMVTPAPVVDLAVDASGRRCVIVGNDGRARELQADLHTWSDVVPEREVRLVCFSHAGNLVLADRSGALVLHGADGSLRTIGLPAGVVVTALEAHGSRDLLLVGTEAGTLLAIEESAGTHRAWRMLQDGQPVQSLLAIRCAPDSRWVATQSEGKHIAVADLDAHEQPVRHFGGMRLNDPIEGLAVIGNRLATSHRHQVVQLRDLQSNVTTTLTGATSWIYRLQASADGTLLAGGCADGTILVWDLESGKVTHRVRGPGSGPACMVFDPAANRLLVALQVGPLRSYGLRRERTPRLRGHQAGVRWCVAPPEGSALSLVTWAADGTARAWGESLVPRALSGSGDELITSATLLPGGRGFVAIDGRGRLHSWSGDAEPVGEALSLPEARANVTLLSALSTDHLLVSSQAPKQPRRLWHLVLAGQRWQQLDLPTGLPDPASVWGMASSPDGRELLLGLDDGMAMHLAFDGKVLTTLGRFRHQPGVGAEQSFVQRVAIAPDGQRLLTGGNDRIARLWDRDGRLVATLSGHEEMLAHVAFSPDGVHIVTLSADEAWLWDRDGKPVFRIQSDGGAFSHCAFLADSRRLAITSTDGSVWVEPVVVEDLVVEARRRQTRALTEEVLAPYAELFGADGAAGKGR